MRAGQGRKGGWEVEGKYPPPTPSLSLSSWEAGFSDDFFSTITVAHSFGSVPSSMYPLPGLPLALGQTALGITQDPFVWGKGLLSCEKLGSDSLDLHSHWLFTLHPQPQIPWHLVQNHER